MNPVTSEAATDASGSSITGAREQAGEVVLGAGAVGREAVDEEQAGSAGVVDIVDDGQDGADGIVEEEQGAALGGADGIDGGVGMGGSRCRRTRGTLLP